MSTSARPSDPSSALSSSALRGAVDLSALAERARRRPAGESAAPASVSGAPAASEQAQAGAAGASAAPKPRFVVDVNDSSFQQFMQLSTQVICLVGFYADQFPGSEDTVNELVPRVAAFNGRIAYARVRGEDAPGVIQAFQLQTLPAAVALIKGQPVPIFQGTEPSDWDDIFSQLIQLGDQHGVVESISPEAPEGAESPEQKDAPALSPEHAEAAQLMAEEKWEEAIAVYQRILDSAPADAEAKKAQDAARLQQRLTGADAAAARQRAAGDQDDLEAQLIVADHDFLSGFTADALTRLIRFIAAHPGEEREAARNRVLEYFEMAGAEDPAVGPARRQLAAALF